MSVRYLLDTNVVSELMKEDASPVVVSFIDTLEEYETVLSVLTLGEISKGISRLPLGAKRTRYERNWSSVESRFEQRIIGIDARIAVAWGRMSGALSTKGMTLHPIDGLLAATCKVNGLAIVTRNVDDFAATSIDVVNPWLRS